MLPLSQRVGVQSWCFRNFKDNAQVVDLLAQVGSKNLELCGVHCNFRDPVQSAQVAAYYQQAGITIDSIGVERLSADEAAIRPIFEFAKLARCRTISVDFLPQDLPANFKLADKLAEEYDIRLGIHNHGGYHWLGSMQMLKYVLSITSPRIGVTLDTAWMMDAKGDPVKAVQELGSRLFALHFKDFIFHRNRASEDVIVGTGNLNLVELAKALRTINFSGTAVIEYELQPENPVLPLQGCLKNIVAALAQEGQ